MNNDFLQYIDRLVLLAFFSGYPLAYAIVSVLFNDKKIKQLRFPAVVRSFLPYSYALCGTLYLGLVLKDLYPSYSIETFVNFFDHSFLKIWALFSLLFWIPLFSKKPFISLIHSSPFFLYIIKDVFLLNSTASGHDMIRNEIKIYSDSLILNVITLTLISLLFFIIRSIRRKNTN